MNKFSKLMKNILLSNIKMDSYNFIYRKVVLINILLILTFFLFSTFGIYYIFIDRYYIIGAIDLILLVSIMYAFINLRKTQTIDVAATLVTSNIFIALLVLAVYKEALDFTLAWTIFMPITAILINGTKKGLYITLFFYSLLFTSAYMAIGTWQDGLWNLSAYIRLVLISSFLTLIIYLFEHSLENISTLLEQTRKNERAYLEELKQVSVTDSLTSLYNRRHLETLFHDNFIKARDDDNFFIFVVLDLDYFKNYNDAYGHDEGDKVLKNVAKILENNMRRKTDTAFRLGGEEFACVLTLDKEVKIFNLIEKIRGDIENLGTVTASFGIAIIKSYENESFDKIYKIADEFLYKAKEKGRNQIIGRVVSLKPTSKSN